MPRTPSSPLLALLDALQIPDLQGILLAGRRDDGPVPLQRLAFESPDQGPEMMAAPGRLLHGHTILLWGASLPKGPGYPSALLRAGGHALLVGLSGAHRPLCEDAVVESAPGARGTPEPVPGANAFLRALAERHALAEGEAVALPPPPQSAHARLEAACPPQVAAWLEGIRRLDPRLRARGAHLHLELHATNGHAFAHLLPRRPTPFRRR